MDSSSSNSDVSKLEDYKLEATNSKRKVPVMVYPEEGLNMKELRFDLHYNHAVWTSKNSIVL